MSGFGASMYPGRWNKWGTPVLYTGSTPEIALLEYLVHLPAGLSPSVEMLSIELPDDSIEELNPEELPSNWHHYPAPSILADIGQVWIDRQSSIALKVPSCIIHSSRNYLLNCRHPRYGEVKIIEREEFRFDKRLLK